MRRKIWSFVLVVSMLLVLTPDTAMAAKMEGQSLQFRTTAVRTEKEETEQTEKETGEQRPAKTGTAGSSLQLEGEGTQAAPYRIKNGEQLRAFADMVNGGANTGVCAVLACDIDLSGVCGADIGSWTPIGTKANPYTGSFDGGSFAVTGLYYHKSGSSYAGLFGYNNGVIQNLGVTGADIVAGSYAGGVCGFNNGTITGCYHAASVKGDKYTGGVCGCNGDGGTVSVCHNTGAVNGSKYVGGVCGYNKNETSSCYNTGTVNGTGTSVGGVCGYNKKLLSSCYNTGEVNGGGKDYVGSICGYNHSEGTLSNCYYLVTGTEKGNYGTAVTQEQFASGEVCWLLNEGKSDSGVWRQSCGSGLPTFGGKVVYQVKQRKANETVVAYSNEKKTQAAPATASSTVSAQSNDSGSYTEENSGGHIYQEPEWKWKKYDSAKAVFTCLDCGEELTLKASISKEETKATCTEDGEIEYKASVEKDGQTYKDKKTEEIEKTGHKKIEEIKQGAATCVTPAYKMGAFICRDCGNYFLDKRGTIPLSKKDVVEAGSKPEGHNYDNVKPDWILADTTSNPPKVTATFVCARAGCNGEATPKVDLKKGTGNKQPTCEQPGNVTYTASVTFNKNTYVYSNPISVEIPAKGHNFKHVEADIYWCSECKTKYKVTTQGGTTTVTPADGTTTQEETKNDSDDTAPDDKKQEETAPVDADPTLPSDSGETPEDSASQTTEGEDGAGDQEEPDVPGTEGDQDKPEAPDGQEGGSSQDKPETPGTENQDPGQNDPVQEENPGGENQEPTQSGSGEENQGTVPGESDGESGEAAANALEDAARYGLIYPEGIETENDSMAQHTWEETAFHLRADSSENGMAQAKQEQQGVSLWISVAVLAVLAGAVLFFALRRKNN